MYKATIIKDSISPSGDRLTTFEITYPRIVHAEFMTHREFSRNAASSRAIPISKMISAVQNDPFIPIWWGKNQSGMQAKEELTGQDRVWAENLWMEARDNAALKVKQLSGMESCTDFGSDNRIDLHKQIANRLLEPFGWITVIVTSTGYGNWFAQRCDGDAQPEIIKIACMMRDLYYARSPELMTHGQWHLPYIQTEEAGLSLTVKRKVSVARCARVSYLTHDGVRDIQKDVDMFDNKLLTSGHWSPFEHVAQVPCRDMIYTNKNGNFKGWNQFRKQFDGEYRTYTQEVE